MKNRFLPIIPAVPMLSVLFSPSVFAAQDSLSDEGKMLLAQTDALLNKTQGWSHQSAIICCLMIAVGALGFMVWTLQKVKRRPWCEGVTSALGLIIVVLTVINTTAFDTDYRTLRRNARRLNPEIMEAKYMLKGFDGASEADKQIYRQTIIDLIKKVDGVEEQMLGTQSSLELFSTTYAFSEQPTWISNPPADRLSDYFVGKGENHSLAAARNLAYNDAMENAVRRLGSRLAESTISAADPLRKYVTDSAAVTQSDFSYDGSRGVYRYYLLLKINRALAQPAFVRAVVHP